MGHVYEALIYPDVTYAWKLLEDGSNFYFLQGAGHNFQNPSGVTANQFEKRVSLEIGSATIISPEDYDKF